MTALILALLESKEQSDIIGGCLKKAGNDVFVAQSFIKAKDILLRGSCDLIISDVHLQNGGSVFDFLKWVRSNPPTKVVPFVLLSLEPTEIAKYLGDGVRYASRVLGASKYISMGDFDPVLLMSEISEFLPEPESVQVFSDSR